MTTAGAPGWLLALVPLAVLAAVVVRLVLGTRRGDWGSGAGGRRRAPWVWPVLGGVAAFVVLRLLTG